MPSVGLVRRQNDVQPPVQLRQVPQAMLNGTLTRSPTLTRPTPAPTSTTTPMFSWPRTLPSSTAVRPSYMCRSDPQMFVVVDPDHRVERGLDGRDRPVLDRDLLRTLV